jgi:hypothetical protein
MLFIKYILITAATGLLGAAAAVVIADIYNSVRGIQPMDVRWRAATRLALLAWIPLLPALSVVVVPSGMAGVRVSQLSGTLAGTLYPGTHLVMPLVHRVELFNIRDQVFSTNPAEAAKDAAPVLKVYSKEGLPVGLGISVRYQLDPQRLPYVQNSLPQPIMMVPMDGKFFFANDVLKTTPLAGMTMPQPNER